MHPSGDRDRLARPLNPLNGTARVRALLCGLGAGVLGLAMFTACTSGGGPGDSLTDNQPADGTSTASPAPPGTYKELPQPCGTVARGTLRSLLPDAADYAGTAELTYDTDRRVGCAWSSTSDGGRGGSHYLTVDLERIVSYDPAVSDDSAAEQDYSAKAAAAGIPATAVVPSPSDTASGPAQAAAAGTGSPRPPSPGTPSGSAPTSGPPGGTPDDSAAPGSRALSDLGDEGYLDDVLTTRDSGVHRDITIVFREANVLITVKLSQWTGDKRVIPASPALQQGARTAAREIARQFD